MTDSTKCKYCFSQFSSNNFPCSLSCKCLVCGNCAEIFAKNITVCPLCVKTLNLDQINRDNVYYQKMTSSSDYSKIEEEKTSNDSKLQGKIDLCNKIIQEKKKSLAALKSIKPIVENLIKAQKLKNCSLAGDLEEKIEFLKKNELLKLEITNEAKNFLENHVESFTKSILTQILQNETMIFSIDQEVFWTGNELLNRNMEEQCENVIVSDSDNIELNSIGVILGGTNFEGSHPLTIEVFISNEIKARESLESNEIIKGRYVKELKLGKIKLPAGENLKIVFTSSRCAGIVMKVSPQISFRDTVINIEGEYSKIAYLKLTYNVGDI